jgi:hypothetical protein
MKDKSSGNITSIEDGGWEGNVMENYEKRKVVEQNKLRKREAKGRM